MFQCVLISLLVSLKIESLHFWISRVGRGQILQSFEWGCSYGGWGGAARVRLTDLEFSGWGYEKKGEVNISGWGWYPGGHYVYFWCFMVVEVHTVTDQILWNSYCIMRGLNAELNLVFLNLFTGEITFQYHLINLCNLVKQRS